MGFIHGKSHYMPKQTLQASWYWVYLIFFSSLCPQKQQSTKNKSNVTGQITITSPHENVITTCYKVLSSGKIYGGKSSPQYALFGVNNGISFFWDEPTTFLGRYANKEQITKEISEIHNAIVSGTAAYVLKYSAKTERKWIKLIIIEQ